MDAGTPPPVNECGLPVDAFLAEWHASTTESLELANASRPLFVLLDQLDVGVAPASLQGLTLAQQRMAVVAAATRTSGFAVSCVQTQRLVQGNAKSILQVARAVNVAAGSPVPAAQVGAGAFKRHDLVYEVAAANDEGEGLKSHPKPTTQPASIIANPVKQLFGGFSGARQARPQLWLVVTNSQTGLEALLRELGDSTPPPVPTVATVASPTATNPVYLGGTAEAGTQVHVVGGANPAATTADAFGSFSVAVVLNANATNHLSVFAEDAAGNLSPAAALDVVHDGLPPTVTFASPANLAVLTHATTVVQLTVSDASQLSTVTVNGVAATLANGSWTAEVPLPLGDSYLVATATDEAGNPGLASIGVTRVAAEGAAFITAAQGGTIAVPLDAGSPLAGSVVTIPPGALPSDSLVALKIPEAGAVTSLDVASAVGLPIELEPTGVTFASPVQVALRYNPALVSLIRESEASVELFRLDPTGGWSAVPSTPDVANHLLLASLTHFSLYQAGSRCPTCLKAEIVAGDPTATDRDDGEATALRIDPWWVAPMATGPMVMLDTALTGAGARVRLLDGLRLTTLAGTLSGGSTAEGVDVRFADLQNPYVVALDTTDGTLYFATQSQPALVRSFKVGGTVQTVAGSATTPVSLEQMAFGASYPATAVDLREIRGLVVGPAGELYISSAEALLKLQSGALNLVAGGNPCAPCTGVCTQCRPQVQVMDEILNYPKGVLAEEARLLEQTQGLVSMSVGGQLLYFANAVSGVRVLNLSDHDEFLFGRPEASDCNAKPITVGPGRVKTIAGIKNGVGGDGDGASAAEATFNNPRSLVLDHSSNLYLADTGNNRIRVINGQSGCVSTFAKVQLLDLSTSPQVRGWEAQAPALVMADMPAPSGIALSATDDLYVAMSGWKAVVRVTNDDVDHDGLANAVDADADGDNLGNDNCPLLATSAPLPDSDGDGKGDACDVCPFDALDDADRDGLCSTLSLRLGLPPPGPAEDLLARATSQLPADRRLVVVSETDFNTALEAAPLASRSSLSLTALDLAYATGEIANDPWTGGLIAHEPAAAGNVRADVFLVTSDARQADTGEVLVNHFTIATVSLTVNARWSARGVSYGIVPTSGAGTGRCCGVPQTCATNSTKGPPVCPPQGLCGNTNLKLGGLGGAPMNTAVRAYDQGLEIDAFCMPKLDPECSRASPVCNGEGPPELNRSYPVEVPFGRDCRGGTFTRGATGRAVPKRCLYANGESESAGATYTKGAGAIPSPECDGQCFDCAGGAPPAVSQRPKQCALMRFNPGEGICESTPQQLAVEQERMRYELGLRPGGSGESCGGEIHIAPFTAVAYWQCTVCTAAGCHQEFKPAPINPIANSNPECSTSSQSSCGAASASDTGEGSSASGGGTASGYPVAAKLDFAAGTQEQAPPSGRTDDAASKPTNGDLRSNGGDETRPSDVVGQSKARAEDPILLGDGSFELQHVDLSFPGPVRTLEFSRSYNSRSKGRSELGSNWSHNWDVRLVPLNDNNRPDWVDPFCAGSPLQTTCVMLHSGDSQRLFTRDPTSGLFMPQAGVMSTLVALAEGRWMLRTPDGHVSSFDADGLLVRDEDRFGNAFTVSWEPNAQGRVFDALCPRAPVYVNAEGNYVDSMGPTERYSSFSAQCALLGGLTGRRRPLLYGPNSPVTLDLVVPAIQQVRDAADLLLAQQTSPGRAVGSASPWGARFARVTRVTDTEGRALDFEYFPDTDETRVAGGDLFHAGLLKEIRGPGGARIEFAYATPAGHPPHLNEVFLTAATRADGPAPVGLQATPQRAQRFTYAWLTNTALASEVADARARYNDFLEAYLNCGFHTLGECGQRYQAGFTFVDTGPLLEEHVASILSDVADNIIRVENAGVVESETRYETGLFEPNFDKATRQRWGSSFATASSPSPVFTTTLPEARFEYTEASVLPGADVNTADDVTTAFLDPIISARYPLERLDTFGAALQSATEKGMLLPRNSPPTTLRGLPLPAIAEGDFLKSSSEPRACKIGYLPALRTRIAGYTPSLDYFDTVVPTTLNDDAPTPGVNLDGPLKRARVSCDMLARAQTWDARHNDLQWTWAKQTFGDYVSTRILGRRQHMNANANRICAWTKLTDRDGDLHVYGLNYHGRALVDAVKVGTQWKFAETLFNADGNVISQRRTLSESQSWTPTEGDTRYAYMDLVDTGATLTTALPAFWGRRGNVSRIIQRPRGGEVKDEVEGAPGTTQTSHGRFALYEYEPFFNQVRSVVSGSIDSTGGFVPSLTTTVLFDYQEKPLVDLALLLNNLRAFGYGFPSDERGNLRFDELQTRLAVTFSLGDVNGDHVFGGTLAGLPVQVSNQAPSGEREFSLYRWNPSGRPYFVQRPDFSVESMLYLPAGALSGTGTALGGGRLASIQHVVRKDWPATDGPTKLPCRFLAGPYQWLLPDGCSSGDLVGQLQEQLKLPTEAAKAIAQQQEATVDATTTFVWHVTGQSRTATRPDNSRTEYERDVDGRVVEEKLYDADSALHSRSVTTWDALMRPTEIQTEDGQRQSLGATFQEWDEEGQLLYQCAESVTGGCAHAGHGLLPAGGTSATHFYSPGGQLERSLDAEGAATAYIRDARKWVRQALTSAPGEVTRGTFYTYDDDGQVLTTVYGEELRGLLSETRGYDGLARLSSFTDTEGRSFSVGTSRRELTARVDLLSSPSTPPLWRSTWTFDGFGRALTESTNGTLTQEVRRRVGGQAYASRTVGQRWKYTTTNADGVPVFEEDERGEVTTVRTAVPGSRLVTVSSISRANGTLLTTSMVRRLDVLGDVVLETETGEGTSQSRLSRDTDFVRNAAGFVSLVMSADGAQTENVYDFLGRPTLKKQLRTVGVPGFDETSYGYDRRGALLQLQDAKGEATTQEYTGFGEPKKRTSLPQVVSRWTYDVLGRVLTEKTGASSLTYDYEETTGRLRSLLGVGGVAARGFEYDSLGRVQTATHHNLGLDFPGSPVGASQRVVTNKLDYDSLGRVSVETSQVGQRAVRTTGSTWTLGGGWTREVARPDGASAVESFDTLGRLESMLRPSRRGTEWQYQGGLEKAVISGMGVATPLQKTTEYDGLGQALKWTHAAEEPVQVVEVLRDKVGRIGSFSRTVSRPGQPAASQWRGYEFDAMGRLTKAHEAAALPTVSAPTHTLTPAQVASLSLSARAEEWSYTREDSIGSLLSITRTTGGGAPRFVSPTRGPGHQLREYELEGSGARQVEHDSAGRVRADGNRAYVWDDFSALVAVTEGASLVEALQYDGFGRLVARWNAGGLVEELAYDGAQMVASFDASGAVKWRAVWAPGIDSLLSISDGTDEYLALDDGKANVAGYVRAADGFLAGTVEYTPEGRAKWTDFRTNASCAERGEVACAPLLDFPFAFHGGYESAGTGLVYFRNRWYSTEAGQWLSQDPLGYVDSFNSYAFNKFDPVNFVDPWGLSAEGENYPDPGASGGVGIDFTTEESRKAAAESEETRKKRDAQADTADRRGQGHAARADRDPKRSKTDEGAPAQPNAQRHGNRPPPAPKPTPRKVGTTDDSEFEKLQRGKRLDWVIKSGGHSYVTSAPGDRTSRYFDTWAPFFAGAWGSFAWDKDNRLRTVTPPTGTPTNYNFDANGLRTQRVDGTGTTRYLLDGQSVLEELDGTNATTIKYLNNPQQTDEVLACHQRGERDPLPTESAGTRDPPADLETVFRPIRQRKCRAGTIRSSMTAVGGLTLPGGGRWREGRSVVGSR